MRREGNIVYVNGQDSVVEALKLAGIEEEYILGIMLEGLMSDEEDGLVALNRIIKELIDVEIVEED